MKDLSKEQIAHVKSLAKDLIDDGTNEEYTRGICELIGEIDAKLEISLDIRSEEIKKELLMV